MDQDSSPFSYHVLLNRIYSNQCGFSWGGRKLSYTWLRGVWNNFFLAPVTSVKQVTGSQPIEHKRDKNELQMGVSSSIVGDQFTRLWIRSNAAFSYGGDECRLHSCFYNLLDHLFRFELQESHQVGNLYI